MNSNSFPPLAQRSLQAVWHPCTQMQHHDQGVPLLAIKRAQGAWLYDADGNQVGTALANTNHLKAGGSWKFEALGTVSPDQVASWERSDVSGF